MKNTKFILFAMLALALYSCSNEPISDKVITDKSYTDFWGNPMPKCICRFTYPRIRSFGDPITFEDSCHLYMVGDTLVGQIKKAQ